MAATTEHMQNKKGEWLCPQCSTFQDPSEFQGTKGTTKLCETCRAKGRASMRKVHERRRMGIKVGRNGRPSLKPEAHITMTFQVPYPIHKEVESMVTTRILQYQNSLPTETAPEQDDLPTTKG